MKNSYGLLMSLLLLFISCNDTERVVDIIDNEQVEEYLPTGELPKREDHIIKVHSASASSFQPGMGIEKTIDGDKKTLFSAGWYCDVEGFFPVTMDYNFENSEGIDYCIYYPRPTGNNGNFQKVEVWYCTEDKIDFIKCTEINLNGFSGPGIINFPERIQAKSIRFIVRERVVGGAPVCAEMEFYQRGEYELGFDLLSIFTDRSCSEIKKGVTEDQIKKIENEFFKNLALSIYKKGYPEIRAREYKSYVDPQVIAQNYKIGTYSLRDNPTGIYVDAENELYVMADGLKGKNVVLLVQDLEKGFEGDFYSLIDGINTFKIKNKGLIYVMYYTSTGIESPVKINIATGKINGLFRKGGSAGEWTTLLNKAVDKHIDVVGEHAHLTFPVASFKESCKDGNKLIEQYDEVVKLEKEFMGLDIANRMYFKVSYKDGVYMHSTGYRTVYHVGTLSNIASEVLFAKNLWGPAHEVGHSNQTRPGLKWAGTTEVTNNIQSLFVQTSFGEESSLLKGRAGYKTTYEQALDIILSAHKPHSYHVKEFFAKLVPFWQLQLYYAKVKGKKDFYKKIYEYIRTHPDPASDGLCQIEFAKIASIAAGEDLTDFFQKWGFLTPVNTQIDDYGMKTMIITEAQIAKVCAEIKALNLPKPKDPIEFINDLNIDIFKSGSKIIKGEVAISGRTVTMTGWKNIVGYQVYKDGVLVKATQSEVITLDDDLLKVQIVAVGVSGDKVVV